MTDLAVMIEEAAALCDRFDLEQMAAQFRVCTTLEELIVVYQSAVLAIGAAKVFNGLGAR